MTRLRRALRRVARAVLAPPRAVAGWWSSLDPPERVMYRGLVLVAAGLAAVWPPAAAIVPGAVLVAVSLGFTLRRAG